MRFGTSRRDPRARTRERGLGSPPPSPSLNFKATRSYIRITQCSTLLRTQGRRFTSIHSRSVNCERLALTANYAANSLRAPPLRLPRHSALSWIDERRCGICANACDGTFSNAMRGQLHRRPGMDDERASPATPRQRPALVPKPSFTWHCESRARSPSIPDPSARFGTAWIIHHAPGPRSPCRSRSAESFLNLRTRSMTRSAHSHWLQRRRNDGSLCLRSSWTVCTRLRFPERQTGLPPLILDSHMYIARRRSPLNL